MCICTLGWPSAEMDIFIIYWARKVLEPEAGFYVLYELNLNMALMVGAEYNGYAG